jgi:hypothetical protein
MGASSAVTNRFILDLRQGLCNDPAKLREPYAFDNGVDEASPLRERLVRSFDPFVGISDMDDAQAAAAIRERRIDILVSLNGYFGYHVAGERAYDRVRRATFRV